MSDVFTEEEQSLLNLTIMTRKKIIKTIMKGGVPDKTNNQIFLVNILDGLDRTILTKAKIKSDSDSSQEENRIKDSVAAMLMNMKNMETLDNTGTPKKLSNNYIIENPVPGEKDIGQQNLNYDEFIKSL